MPSVDPSSTTTASSAGWRDPRSERSVFSMTAASLYAAISTVTNGWWSGGGRRACRRRTISARTRFPAVTRIIVPTPSTNRNWSTAPGSSRTDQSAQ